MVNTDKLSQAITRAQQAVDEAPTPRSDAAEAYLKGMLDAAQAMGYKMTKQTMYTVVKEDETPDHAPLAQQETGKYLPLDPQEAVDVIAIFVGDACAEGPYGGGYWVHLFTVGDANLVINRPHRIVGIVPGGTYRVTGHVVRHETYQGRRQTVVKMREVSFTQDAS